MMAIRQQKAVRWPRVETMCVPYKNSNNICIREKTMIKQCKETVRRYASKQRYCNAKNSDIREKDSGEYTCKTMIDVMNKL